ncbi:hypothetical protein BC939DRAFT_231834 [Gamsiella multidivaricata]|uniref:uncharacterized protein n=1 Tax=Gamsiella multidivaricata TaxID=101098 RepID=UPI00221F9C81|nr:uncharacterized protein BC939DRAFT_231834 [Gamsiella multidivaricata]KAI7820553.1 hypothetical protein BC939DRAFT_231834 [Gamsiella multidivaricata]
MTTIHPPLPPICHPLLPYHSSLSHSCFQGEMTRSRLGGEGKKYLRGQLHHAWIDTHWSMVLFFFSWEQPGTHLDNVNSSCRPSSYVYSFNPLCFPIFSERLQRPIQRRAAATNSNTMQLDHITLDSTALFNIADSDNDSEDGSRDDSEE